MVETVTLLILLLHLQFRQRLVGIAILCFTWQQLGRSKAWGWNPLQTHSQRVLVVNVAYPLRLHLELWLEHLIVVFSHDCLASLQRDVYIPRVRVPGEREPGGVTSLRSHVMSFPPCSFGCGFHRVLPMFEERECRSHLLVEEC